MKYMTTYDLMESARNTNAWLGATRAGAMASYPAFALSLNPMIQLTAAWGEVTERTFARMAEKPDWGIRSIVGPSGQDHIVDIEKVVEKPFGNLLHFNVRRREPTKRRVLLVAPMSGHYATLLRSTVTSLLPDCDVYVTDWANARDIPVSAGKFDVEDYTPLPRGVHAPPRPRHACDLGVSAGAADACGDGPSRRRGSRCAAPLADADRRAGGPRRRRDRRDGLRSQGHDGATRGLRDPARGVSSSRARGGSSIPA